jgi:two-component system, response regulator RegA
MTQPAKATAPVDLLLVDDNDLFRQTLARSLARRGWKVDVAANGQEALASARRRPPARAVVDLGLDGSSGLELIPQLLDIEGSMRIIVLTGYASIATAVEAIRRGATHYLAKPADVDQILSAFDRTTGSVDTPIPTQPMSLNQLEWEHLQRTLLDHAGNISSAARALGLHRRSLQRKLRKHARW